MKAVADRPHKALNGRGKEVMALLFPKVERNKLARLAAELRDISTLAATQAGTTQSLARTVLGLGMGGGVSGSLGALTGSAMTTPSGAQRLGAPAARAAFAGPHSAARRTGPGRSAQASYDRHAASPTTQPWNGGSPQSPHHSTRSKPTRRSFASRPTSAASSARL